MCGVLTLTLIETDGIDKDGELGRGIPAGESCRFRSIPDVVEIV